MSVDIPIPSTHTEVPLSTIFWNGEVEPLNKETGMRDIQSPEEAGSAKTMTITNYDTEPIYPFLRSSNSGVDPNDSKQRHYDPQDLQTRKDEPGYEFRQYVGYSKGGLNYLGLPPGASITFQVPLVLWDGNNISLVTDGTNLTTPRGQPGDTLFGYDINAKISIAGLHEEVSNSTWVQESSNYAADQSPLVMFYFAATAATVSDDAPSQPAEVTFRDPYLKHFIDDPFQTFPIINYDVSNVNKLAAPAAMEASSVPITSGAVHEGNLTYYPPPEDFGWHGSDKDFAEFKLPLVVFVKKTNNASLGMYFGGKGWPTFYNPNENEINIPSGSNIFDLSPLDVHGTKVHTSNFDSNRWILSSSGGGAIQASASGDILKNDKATNLPLNFSDQQQRLTFVNDINSMKSSEQPIDLTVTYDKMDQKYKGVLGKLVDYDPSSSVRAYVVDEMGSGYSDGTYVDITSSNGQGSGAEGDVHIENSKVVSIGLNPDHAGSGYTAPPIVTIIDPSGQGQGAFAHADITGGTAIVELAPGRTLPTDVGITWVFKRTATDYAATAITDLWYSWAKYYVDLFDGKTAPQPVQGDLVHQGIDGDLLTNEIKLESLPSTPLAVGMGVTAEGIYPGTTILKIEGNTIFLSQIPTSDAPMTQEYRFENPAALPIDEMSKDYTQTFDLTFGPADELDAKLFAASVYESLQIQSVDLPPSPYLPTTMNLVAHVIKFWANLPTHTEPWGPTLVGQARDLVKSILRGVHDYYQVPDQSKWYPEPSVETGGQKFNVFNLDPYVWFVHKIENLDGYAFSVDDDIANPAATGPRGDDSNHFPENLQIGFAGIKGTGALSKARELGNQKQWFPTTRWGSIETTATIGVWQGPGAPEYQGYSFIQLVGNGREDAIRTLNKIITPGPGQVGAFIWAGFFIVPGTTLIFFPDGVTNADKPTIILSQKAISTVTDIKVTINAAQTAIPRIRSRSPAPMRGATIRP